MGKNHRIQSFKFAPGDILAGRYVIEERLGSGWEGEVFRVIEKRTRIRRAAKLFYPHRNIRDKALRQYARKLDKLRTCSGVIQYHHSDDLTYKGKSVTYLISELVEGILLDDYVRMRPGRRLPAYESLHVLYAVSKSVEQIHLLNEYHGDLHGGNILIQRRGIGFGVKMLDFYHWGRPSRQTKADDVVQLVQLFYESVGGRKRYAVQPPEIKEICKGLRRDLIIEKFPTAGHLRRHLESFTWE